MPSRRSHPKTRTGCGNCKRRRIKCDENKPSCARCLIHSINCDYSQVQENAQVSPDLSSQASPLACANTARESHLIPGNSLFSGSYSIIDLELMHHFTTTTSLTVSTTPEINNIWKYMVPRLASSHEFLMRAILAFAALHSSRLKPASKVAYEERAALHQKIAFFCVKSEMSNITSDNCDALFAFSGLVAALEFAAPRKPGFLLVTNPSTSEGAAGAPDWIINIRGVNAVLTSARDWIEVGVLAPMLLQHLAINPGRLPPKRIDQHLRALRGFVTNGAVCQDDLQAYITSIGDLSKSFAILYDPENQICSRSAAMIWPVVVPQTYIALLSRRTPEALAILAHWAVLLHTADSFWWMSGWSTDIISAAYDLLDDAKKQWIGWPMEEVGILR